MSATTSAPLDRGQTGTLCFAFIRQWKRYKSPGLYMTLCRVFVETFRLHDSPFPQH